MLVNLPDPGKKQYSGAPLLSLGFRPFFLLAGAAATLLMVIWGLQFQHGLSPGRIMTASWHGHEMVYGYTVAVIAGFLLTAVKNWTGMQTPQGPFLFLLAFVWLSARLLALFTTPSSYWLFAIVDLSLLPLLAIILVRLLLKSRNYRNLVFIAILLILACCNLIYHLGAVGVVVHGERYGLYGGVYVVLLLISIMGGRVIPFFIERGLGVDLKARNNILLDAGSNLALLLLGVLHTSGNTSTITGMIAMMAAILHLVRLSRWYQKGLWRHPLLWVLVTAYAWLVGGIFLISLACFGLYDMSLALHALTIGGIGLVTMGMMVRVSMGHSGRPLVAPRHLPLAFVLLNVAVVTRVGLAQFLPSAWYADLVLVAVAAWVAAFAIFLVRMVPVYLSPRVDDRPAAGISLKNN